MVPPIEKYLKLDKWTDTLRWWIRTPLVFGFFFACLFVQNSTKPELDTDSEGAYLTPYFGDLQIQVESRSPHLAVLRIRPRGILDFGVECYDGSTKNPVADCGKNGRYYSSTSVLCFTEIAIDLSTPEEIQKNYTDRVPYYSRRPCIGSRALEQRPGFAGIWFPWMLKEEPGPGRFIISNDNFEEEFQWWFDPTVWVPKDKSSWVWRVDVSIDSINRTTYFSVVSGNGSAPAIGNP